MTVIPSPTGQPALDVFYDGDCPICQWEVRYYERLDKAQKIRWIDIESLAPDQLPSGKTRDALLGKFHVRDREDKSDTNVDHWHIGVDAFARIWKFLPGFRHFAFIFRTPVLRQVLIVSYRLFLKWQSWHRLHRRTT